MFNTMKMEVCPLGAEDDWSSSTFFAYLHHIALV